LGLVANPKLTRSKAIAQFTDPKADEISGLDPALLPTSPSQARRLIALRQVADRLVAGPFVVDESSGSLLGLIWTRNGLIKVD
jgi:hypothetical protein